MTMATTRALKPLSIRALRSHLAGGRSLSSIDRQRWCDVLEKLEAAGAKGERLLEFAIAVDLKSGKPGRRLKGQISPEEFHFEYAPRMEVVRKVVRLVDAGSKRRSALEQVAKSEHMSRGKLERWYDDPLLRLIVERSEQVINPKKSGDSYPPEPDTVRVSTTSWKTSKPPKAKPPQ